MEITTENIARRGGVPFPNTLSTCGAGWLYSTPVSRTKYLDPVREEFSFLGGGKVLRRWRSDINEPFQYEVFSGSLEISLAGVVILAKEIKRLLEKEGVLAGDDADIFIDGLRQAFRLFRSEIENDLKKDIGSRLEESHPLIAYLKVEPDADLADSIEYFAECIFPAKKTQLRDFLVRHEDDLMTIKVVRKFKVYRE